MQLPRKMSAQNVMASITRTLGNRDQKANAANEIRFAGDERKDKLYEPKHKQKLVRVLTVVAYVIFVSMAAILLSLYYTFLWDPKDLAVKMRIRPECAHVKYQAQLNAVAMAIAGDNDTQAPRTAMRAATPEVEHLPGPEATTRRQMSLLAILTQIATTEIPSSNSTAPTSSEDFTTDSIPVAKSTEGSV